MENKTGDLTTTALRELIAETDKRYEQRFLDLDKSKDTAFNAANTAINTAITAQKTAMDTAFTAAEKVSMETKRFTEDKLKSIDVIHEQMRVQLMTVIPRQEWQITVTKLEEAIKELKISQATTSGEKSSAHDTKNMSTWIIGVLIAIAAIIVNAILRH